VNLTIGYITSRFEPQIDWFLQSLALQMKADDQITVIIVDGLFGLRKLEYSRMFDGKTMFIRRVSVIPNIWQGPHRVRKVDNWAASAARNTAICLCQTEWIAFCDDRCVLAKNWLNCIRDAMHHGYCVAGSYEKRVGVVVKDGVITNGGTLAAQDSRADLSGNANGPVKAPGEWLFGCTLALPLEWALKVNGYDMTCDGISMEDVIFGLQLQNNGYPIYFDRRMMIIEDRTPENCLPIMYREDRGVSPNDKSHAMLAKLRVLKAAIHLPVGANLRAIRDGFRDGKPPPIPPKQTWLDWWDSSVINQL
jgi:hypothetical protein